MHTDITLGCNNTHAVGVVLLVLSADVKGVICTAILAHNNLDSKIGSLTEHALYRLGDIAGVVVGGHTDR